MNKFLKVFGAVFLALIVVIAVVAAIFVPKAMALDQDAVAYVEANVPLIVEKWNADDLRSRAAPELLALPNMDQLPKLFSWLSALGKLKKLEKPIGRIGTGAYPGTSFDGTWGDYVVDAEFEAGKAQVKVVLRKDGESWKIMGFHIQSPALLPKG